MLLRRASGLLLGCMIASSCATAPAYDQTVDQMLTALQGHTTKLYQELERAYPAEGCRYETKRQQWQDIAVDIRLLRLRVENLSSNRDEIASAIKLADLIAKSEAAHKAAEKRPDHCLLPQIAELDAEAIERNIASIQRIELTKKGPEAKK